MEQLLTCVYVCEWERAHDLGWVNVEKMRAAATRWHLKSICVVMYHRLRVWTELTERATVAIYSGFSANIVLCIIHNYFGSNMNPRLSPLFSINSKILQFITQTNKVKAIFSGLSLMQCFINGSVEPSFLSSYLKIPISSKGEKGSVAMYVCMHAFSTPVGVS